ncbi:hypothetical protein TNCT_288061 [Trichonephila clavata]|uniref:Uncharacterized protein n=1 Tax=Trichonephila clavata TaxID=2740835 RepID=A0A8X6GW24_TRICU|nr:hypothetical protein TNCT_288061 [Trichonephila clavata]
MLKSRILIVLRKLRVKVLDQQEWQFNQKSNDASNVETSNTDILLRYIREIDIEQSSIGDIRVAHCVLDDGTNIIMVVAYISPNS